MRQMITRVPDELHEQLRKTAQVRGQSMNEFVVQVLSDVLGRQPTRADVRTLLHARGLLVSPVPATPPPSHADLAARYRGRGAALSEALEADRGASR